MRLVPVCKPLAMFVNENVTAEFISNAASPPWLPYFIGDGGSSFLEAYYFLSGFQYIRNHNPNLSAERNTTLIQPCVINTTACLIFVHL